MEDWILDPRYLNLNGAFDDQINQLLQQIRLHRPEVEHLQCLFKDLERTLGELWPGCEVMPFGSIVTGLGIKTSDVDCYISIQEHQNTPDSGCVKRARSKMQKCFGLYKNVLAIPNCKVPIVKFLHVPTNRFCDINFKSPMGVRNSLLIQHLLQHYDPRILPLAVTLKYWAKVHKLTGTNLLASYSLIMLIIFYLQQKQILPSVQDIQIDATSNFIGVWNTGFARLDYAVENNDSLHQLLGGFFLFYRSFDFKSQIISTFLGVPVPKSSFASVDSVQEDFYLYMGNVRNKFCPKMKFNSELCIQDPFEHNRNCTVGVNRKLFLKIYAYFKHCAEIYESKSSGFLKKILMTEPEIVNLMVEDQSHASNAGLKRLNGISHKGITISRNRRKKMNKRLKLEEMAKLVMGKKVNC